MMRWWHERWRKLWWKEFRESYAVVGLGWVIILIYSYKMPAELSSRYTWGMDLHMTATAILLFVAMVLGVTAYAVEEEYETLEPLMAKPITADDITATKLGVRLGLLFFSYLALAVIELLTGAWPIKYGIPHPAIFERWVGGLMIMIFGCGLGFYFGKVLGKQITGLLSACLVFAAGWVLLELSPLSFAFEGEGGEKIYWIKIILLPALGAIITILASIRARPGAGGPLSRPATAALALAGYALISWSLSVVPPSNAWLTPENYSAEWTARFGSPEAALQVLLDRFVDEDVPEMAEDDPDSISRTMLMNTTVYPASRVARTERTGYSNLLGLQGRIVIIRPDGERIPSLSKLERRVTSYRSADWISRCLEIALQPGHSELHQLTALHLAGLAGHPESSAAISPYLDSPSLYVKLMSAYMLLALDDPRGPDALKSLINQIESETVMRSVAHLASNVSIDFGPEFRSLMQEWLTRTGQNGRWFRDAARFWYRRNGSAEDLDIIRQSLQIDWLETYSQSLITDDWRIWQYLKDWNAPGLLDELHRQMRIGLDYLKESYQEIQLISFKGYRRRTDEERGKINRYNLLTRSLRTIITELGEQYDPAVIELWEEFWPMAYHTWEHPRLIPYITSLPGMGEIGFQKLRGIVDDTRLRIYLRFQAALILSYHGYSDYDSIALRFFELYRSTDFMNYPWSSEPYSTFLVLVEAGNLRFAEPIIEEAWTAFENKGHILYQSQRGYRYVAIGTIRWNNRTAEVLEAVTGKRYGWNLKAWKKWWDEEGRALATAGNN